MSKSEDSQRQPRVDFNRKPDHIQAALEPAATSQQTEPEKTPIEAIQTRRSSTEDWDPSPQARLRRLEAVLFIARSPLSSRKLSQLAGLEDGTQARTMIRQLNARYDKAARAFHVKHIAGGYQLLARPQFSKWLRVMDHIPRRSKLSGPAMETLAVVAYRQPIIKADIEAIRGVSCGEMLRQLLEKGLVRISGRSEELGRPYLYSTASEFLAQFGLANLDDLPRADELAGQGLPTWANSDQISDPQDNSSEANEELTTD